MSWAAWALDGALAALLVGLAARTLGTRDLFEAIVLYIAFGLVLSLAWVRLAAPDVALAEAALGAGVTGALLLNAHRRLSRPDIRPRTEGEPPAREDDGPAGDGGGCRTPAAEGSAGSGKGAGGGKGAGSPIPEVSLRDEAIPGRLALGYLPALVLFGAAGGVLARLLVGREERAPLLPALVDERLPEAGVGNPVTGVLLNFRTYDTLLEVAVMVVAMVAVWSLDRGSREFAPDPAEVGDESVLTGLGRISIPLAAITAVYLTWSGTQAVGGAFQGGALLAGAGVLLVAGRFIHPVTAEAPATRALGVLSLAAFTGVGLLVMVWTGHFLAYPAGWAYGLILGLEAALMISVAVILVELFVDVPAVPAADPSLKEVDPTGDPLGRTLSPDGALIRAAEEDR